MLQNSRLLGRIAVLALSSLVLSNALAADTGYRLVDRQVLEGPVRWDYLTMDSAHQHLFLTRGDHVDVYDTKSKRVVGAVGNTAGVHGVAIAADLNRGYTSNGGNNTVTVFNLTDFSTVATVPTGAGPDSLIYDPATQRVFVANHKDGSVSVIDANTNKSVGNIVVGGTLETVVVDGKGKLFMAVEDKNTVVTIDTHTLKVLRHDSVAPLCDEPAGLAIDATGQTLYAGCHNQKLVMVDAATGKVLGAAAIGKGNDAVAYDSERKVALASNGDGSLSIVDGAAPFAVRQTVATMPRARTLALDMSSHTIYLVSADTEKINEKDAKGADKRPQLKPGTFTLLSVAPN